jgi:hypothetical protein
LHIARLPKGKGDCKGVTGKNVKYCTKKDPATCAGFEVREAGKGKETRHRRYWTPKSGLRQVKPAQAENAASLLGQLTALLSPADRFLGVQVDAWRRCGVHGVAVAVDQRAPDDDGGAN